MSRRIPASLTRAYNRAIKRQGDAAEKAVKAALEEYMRENPDASVEEIREFATEMLQAAGDLYGNACSQAAFELQEEIATEFGTKPPDIGGWLYEPDEESISRTVHYQAGKLVDGDKAGFVKELADAARFYAERGANSTMVQAARRQASSKGGKSKRAGARTHGVTFARVPMGATTCPFCLMLASRGFVYLSEESAGEFDRYHRHCDCRIVPGYPGMELEGYDPDLYYDMWKHPEKYDGIAEVASSKSAIERIGFSNEYAIAGIKYTNHMERLHEYAALIEPMDGYEDVVIHSDGLSFAWKDLNAETWQEGEIEISAVAFARLLKDDANYHGGNIRLVACGAGRYENGAAQMLADLLHVDVYAPIEDARVDKHGKIIVADEDLDDIPEYKLDEEYQKRLWKEFHPGGKK